MLQITKRIKTNNMRIIYAYSDAYAVAYAFVYANIITVVITNVLTRVITRLPSALSRQAIGGRATLFLYFYI